MDYLLNYKSRLISFSDNTDFVLNLIINGLPSKQKLKIYVTTINLWEVLNLIINGLPSKL